MTKSLYNLKPFIKKVVTCSYKIISAVSSALSILSFYGYTATDHNVLLLILSVLFLTIAIITIIVKVNSIKTQNFDYSELMKISTKLPSLVDNIIKRGGNGVYAQRLCYSYKNNKNNELVITINIEGITRCNSNYCVGLLNDIEDSKIKIIVNTNPLAPSSKNRTNKYTLYIFDLPNSENIKDFDISITLPSKPSEESANLFFCPKNYVSEVNVISLSVPNKHYKHIDSKANSYKEPVEVNYDDNREILNIDDKNTLNNIFWFDNYNQ